jgi:hypothetical protein
MEIAGHDHW